MSERAQQRERSEPEGSAPGDSESGTIPMERERRLILAILEEAVRQFQRHAFSSNRRGRRLLGEVCEWFDASDDPWIFSFENICFALDLDPDYIREGLARWQREQRGGTHAPVPTYHRNVGGGGRPMRRRRADSESPRVDEVETPTPTPDAPKPQPKPAVVRQPSVPTKPKPRRQSVTASRTGSSVKRRATGKVSKARPTIADMQQWLHGLKWLGRR